MDSLGDDEKVYYMPVRFNFHTDRLKSGIGERERIDFDVRPSDAVNIGDQNVVIEPFECGHIEPSVGVERSNTVIAVDRIDQLERIGPDDTDVWLMGGERDLNTLQWGVQLHVVHHHVDRNNRDNIVADTVKALIPKQPDIVGGKYLCNQRTRVHFGHTGRRDKEQTWETTVQMVTSDGRSDSRISTIS